MFYPEFTISMGVAESKVLAQHLMMAHQRSEKGGKEERERACCLREKYP